MSAAVLALLVSLGAAAAAAPPADATPTGKFHALGQASDGLVLWDPIRARAFRLGVALHELDGRPASSSSERIATRQVFVAEEDIVALLADGARVSGGLLVAAGPEECRAGARCVLWKAVSSDGRELRAWALVDAVTLSVITRDPADLAR